MLFRKSKLNAILELLQDKTVRREIQKTVLSYVDAILTPDKLLHTLENETIRQKIQNIALEGRGLKTPIDANSSPSSEQVSDMNQEICAAQEAYKAYSSLPQSLREELRNVVNCANVMTFAVSGCIDHNLEVLWDCCRRSIIDGKLAAENIDCLISVFRYYFELLNSSVRDGEYAYLAVKPGDEYEEDFAQGMPGNPAQGIVGQVLLQGFRYTRGKVVRRSLVEIKKESR